MDAIDARFDEKLDAKKLAARDETALRELFDFLRPAIYRYCTVLTRRGDPAEINAEDLAQDTLLRIYRNLDQIIDRQPGLVDKQALARYAYVVARNAMMDHYRRRSRRSVNPPSFSEVLQEQDSSDVWPSDDQPLKKSLSKLDSERSRAILRAVISQLDPADRSILELTIASAQDLTTTAEKLGMSPSALRVRRHRILSKLSKALHSSGS